MIDVDTPMTPRERRRLAEFVTFVRSQPDLAADDDAVAWHFEFGMRCYDRGELAELVPTAAEVADEAECVARHMAIQREFDA